VTPPAGGSTLFIAGLMVAMLKKQTMPIVKIIFLGLLISTNLIAQNESICYPKLSSD
jgi:hypothetical protein